jgi:hypothetical protein
MPQELGEQAQQKLRGKQLTPGVFGGGGCAQDSHLPWSCFFITHVQIACCYYRYHFSYMVLEFELKASFEPHLGPFCFSYFSDRILCFLLGPASGHDPPTYASQVIGITD